MRVVIVGGGPAGAAAAIELGRAGLKPVLVDRHAGPRDVVCGGFLSSDALRALEYLGVDAAALGAPSISRLHLIAGERMVETMLPFQAAGLSRRALDEALLAQASAAGADILRGVSVRSADPENLTIRLSDERELAADALLLATGKHELRGLARPIARGRRETQVVGLRTVLHVSLERASQLETAIELHLFTGGYAGLLRLEDGTVNFCLSVSRARFAASDGVADVIARIAAENPRLAHRLEPDIPRRWDTIAQVPYGWSARATHPRIFRLGDQAAVIASLAGDGIAIALESGVSAAVALLTDGPKAAGAWQAGFSRRAARPLLLAGGLRHVAESDNWRAPMMRLLTMLPGAAPAAARLTRIGRR